MFAPLALQRRCFHVLFCIDLTSVSPGSSSRHGPEEQRAHEDSSYCRHNDSPVGHWRFRLLQVESWIPESAVSQCGKKGFLLQREMKGFTDHRQLAGSIQTAQHPPSQRGESISRPAIYCSAFCLSPKLFPAPLPEVPRRKEKPPQKHQCWHYIQICLPQTTKWKYVHSLKLARSRDFPLQ